MRAVNYPGIQDKGTAAQFLLDVLSDHLDYNPISLTLHAQSSPLPTEQIESHPLRAENSPPGKHPTPPTKHAHLTLDCRTSTTPPRGNRNARRPNHWRGKSCSYHSTLSHDMDEFISKIRENVHHSTLHQYYNSFVQCSHICRDRTKSNASSSA